MSIPYGEPRDGPHSREGLGFALCCSLYLIIAAGFFIASSALVVSLWLSLTMAIDDLTAEEEEELLKYPGSSAPAVLRDEALRKGQRPLERAPAQGAKDMNDDGSTTEVARAYAAAYAAHYSERDLATALELYRDLIGSHASALEAGYSRTQIQNIVKELVPAQELLDAQVDLALAHLERA